MPWWRGKALLLTGQGRQLVAYVWSSAAQLFHQVSVAYKQPYRWGGKTVGLICVAILDQYSPQVYTMRLGVNVWDWKISFGFFDSSRTKCLVSRLKKRIYIDYWHLAKSITNNFTSSLFPPLFHPHGISAIITSVTKPELFSQTFANNSTLDDSGFFSYLTFLRLFHAFD